MIQTGFQFTEDHPNERVGHQAVKYATTEAILANQRIVTQKNFFPREFRPAFEPQLIIIPPA